MVKKESEEEVFYIGIKDPIGMRRAILESSKDIVQYLQRAERFKAVRAEKTEQILKLKGISKELQSLMRKLKIVFPKTKLRLSLYERQQKIKKEEETEKRKKTEKKKEKVKGKEAKKEKPKVEGEKVAKVEKEEEATEEEKKGMTELEKLESELGEIESRLGKLS